LGDRVWWIERLASTCSAQHRQDLRARRIEVLRVLQDRDGPLVVRAPQQDLTQQRESLAIGPVDLDDAEQLALRFFPLVHRRVRAGEHHAPLEVVR
jgi:hypothetical protein